MLPAAVDHALSLSADEAVARMLGLPENQWFERKSGKVKAVDLAVPLVAMANAEGGVVVAGLADGQVVPVSDRADNDLRQAAIDHTRPRVRVWVQEVMSSRGRLLVFRVGPSDHVHETHKGECYQRIGDESRRLSFSQRQELEWDRGVACFDGTPVAGVTVDDLDHQQLSEYQRALGSSTPTDALRARDLLTKEGRLTVAAYLLFAERPHMVFPSAYVRVLRYTDNERGAGRNQNLEDGADVRCEGSLPAQITQATQVIQQYLPRRRVLDSSGRFTGTAMIPQDAWLEGLVNAVVHRSYSIAGDHIRVEIFPHRLEITSPGRFPGTVDPSHPETISRNARNPRIARVCADLGITQELGEGIRRIFGEMRRVGLTDPIYQQTREAVRLTLSTSNAIPDEVVAAIGPQSMVILNALRLAARPLGTGQVAELVNLSRPTVLRKLKVLQEAGLIGWQGESVQDPRATWTVY